MTIVRKTIISLLAASTLFCGAAATLSAIFQKPVRAEAAEGSIALESINFPDEKFRSYVADVADADGDGMLSAEERAAVSEMDVSGRGIETLSGIEYFGSLSYLDCGNNNLSELDVSENGRLGTLICSNNELTALSLTQNRALTNLDCSHNLIEELDFSGNPLIAVLNCSDNRLAMLDLSNNAMMYELACNSQSAIACVPDAESFDLSAFFGDLGRVKALNVEGGTVSDGIITFAGNAVSLTYQYYSGFNFAYMNCTLILYREGRVADVYPNKSTFPDDYFRSYAVTVLDLDGDGILSIEEQLAVEQISVGYSGVVDLKGIEYFAMLRELNCYNNKLTSLDLSYNPLLAKLSCSHNAITELNLSDKAQLSSLSCADNMLRKLDLTKNSKLAELDCSDNDIAELDLSQNGALTQLRCSGNRIYSLNLSGNTALKELVCSDNELSELDISRNSSLTILDCGSQNGYRLMSSEGKADLSSFVDDWNKVSKLSVTGGTLGEDGRTFTADGNMAIVSYTYATGFSYFTMDVTLTLYNRGDAEDIAVDQTSFPDEAFRAYVLKNLDANGDGKLSVIEQMTVSMLDVHGLGIADLSGIEYFVWLRYLDCDDNRLTSLDISKNAVLGVLDCSNNIISELDTSGKAALSVLWCDHNALASLDLSGNVELMELDCSYNALKELDLSANGKLKEASCGSQRAEIYVSGELFCDLSALFGEWEKVGGLSVSDGTLGEDGITLTFNDKSATIAYSYDAGSDLAAMDVEITLVRSYAVTVVGGKIEGFSGASAVVEIGTPVTVIAQTPEGKVLVGWSADGGQTIACEEAVYTFTPTDDVALTAIFEDKPTEPPDEDDPVTPPDEDDKPTEPDDDAPVTPPDGEGGSPSEPSKLTGGAITGIVIASVVAAAIISYVVCAVLYKKKVVSGAFFAAIYPFIK